MGSSATTKAGTTRPARTTAARRSGKSVEGYLGSLSGWQRKVIEMLRDIVGRAAPESSLSIKWGQPVWEDHGPFAYTRAATNHVTFGFWRGTQLHDPHGVLEGEGDRMRHIKIAGLDDLRADVIAKLVTSAVALNRAHGSPTLRK
jgi:hypothetical protein